jgi:N-acetylmuramoyl-L-alanine amidase
MVNVPLTFRQLRLAAISLAVAASCVGPVRAQQADRDLFAAARALEQTARVPFDDPGASAERAIDDIHSAVAAYLLVPKRYPASGYSDDALWRAGRLSLDAFARFGRNGDREAGQRILKRLAAGYPSSKLAKQVPAALDAVSAAAPAVPPVATPVAVSAAVPAAAPEAPSASAPPAAAPAAQAGARPKTASVRRPAGTTATIRSIRRTVLPDAVRIVIELDSEVTFHEERIAGPDRVFLDLSPARAAPALQDQTIRFNSDSDVVRQVRLGRHENRTTRVVLDAGGVGTYSVYALYTPYRLVIDLARGDATAPLPVAPVPPLLLASRRLSPVWGRQLPSSMPLNTAALRAAAVVAREPIVPAKAVPAPAAAAPRTVFAPPAAPPPAALPAGPPVAAAVTAAPASPPVVGPPLPGPPAVVSTDLPGVQAAVITRAPAPISAPPPALAAKTLTPPWPRKPFAALSPRSTAAIRDAVASLPPPAEPASPLGPGTIAPETLPSTVPSSSAGASPADKSARTPEKNSNGSFSIARQLGLGVSRIVIDPGHGGHDPGAMGQDVGEAELVLDVSLRLEKLLQKIPGMDVVLTRRSDDFVSLQERTAIANRENADLFLSIHANASESPQARGVETYFLNFANNLGAAAVAARENAASGQAMAALPDLVKMIALNNKLDESRDLASMVQHAMVERLRGVHRSLKDLGVKQAPFAVLIGAAMPSVLTEVSFVTNAQDAKQLRSAIYRQRIAEALANAVRKYQTSLKTVATVASQ